MFYRKSKKEYQIQKHKNKLFAKMEKDAQLMNKFNHLIEESSITIKIHKATGGKHGRV